MLENILIFMVFLCPLVFFHELGHFIFARLFGVRVEVFSLGFGPKIFKFKKNHTEYAFSIIPLGGYIKMFGDDPLSKDSIPEAERKHSFTFQSKFARFWIVFGGPLANMILAFFIFWALLFVGENLPEIKFGSVQNSTIFYEKGVRSGDILKNVNETAVNSPTDIMSSGELVNSITVERDGKNIRIPLGLDSQSFLELFSKVTPLLRMPIFIDITGQYFLVSLKENTKEIQSSIEQIQNVTGNVDIYLYTLGKDLKFLNKHDLPLFKKININLVNEQSLFSELTKLNLYPHDLVVKSVNMDSPADKSGLKGGDIIYSLDDSSVHSFEQVRAKIQELAPGKNIKLAFLRGKENLTINLQPETTKLEGKDVKVIGVYSSGEFMPLNFIKTPSKGFFGSFPIAFSRTVDATLKTIDGFKKLITKEVSLRNIGGPIAIGKVASDSFKTSLSYFFQIMAFISINLGIINLFPIPVLDGGHIMFIFLEIINRGPLSRRKMEIAQQFGLSILLILTFAALFNDFSKLF